MNKQHIALLVTLLVGAGPAMAQTPEVIYKNSCASCHGRYGEKNALGKARPLKDLSQQEIAEGLRARKAGEIVGAGNKAKARLSDEDIAALSAYVVTLKK
ncbi:MULTISPECIES: c-type cytochrome [unclassified Serratia (in: enterobacteria)]|uniref:c-type cytochrome n=1 Tax=unclassified Serratia (in: enterobacteria) TaxID=2647522 RepID=UPI0004A7966F|nr:MULTISPECIES: c-type cytochrome [unclassified Serratia (in: enterobacteria)]